jgi:hypothetical protein
MKAPIAALAVVLLAWCVLGPSPTAAAGQAGSEPAAPIYVLFTVDVESTLAGGPDRDIWGRLPGESEEHGIGEMMDILDRHGVKGVFFVNVYEAETNGYEVLADVCRAIVDRGHDLELHTHPGPMFGTAYMQHADFSKQKEILDHGAELIKEWAGVETVAHRAGGYMADIDTIRACGEAGIRLDFSHNSGWPASELAQDGRIVNAPYVRDGVLCVPVTCYVQASAGSWRSLRFLDVESSSTGEIRRVIGDMRAHGVRTAVVMLHSFSFVRSPRAAKRLDEVLASLLAVEGVRVVSARRLDEIWRADPDSLAGENWLAETGWWMTYCRAWQRLDEGWKNIVVAFAPPGAVLLAVAVVLLAWRRRRRRSAASAIMIR